MMDYRVILYHKHPTSARTRFLKFSYGSIFAFEPVEESVAILDCATGNTVLHPASVVRKVERRLDLDTGTLKAVGEFCYSVAAPPGNIQIILAEITSIDPPFELADTIGGSFIDLLQARGLPPLELSLLRRAYEFVLGG